MPSNYRGLALLLSIGSLPFACNKDNDDTDSGGSTTTPGTSPTGTTGTGSDTTDPTNNSMSSDPTTTGNSGNSGTSESGTTTGPSTTTGPLDTSATEPQPTTFLTTNTETGFDTGFDTEDLPPPTDPTCIAYGQHVVECNPRYAGYRDYIAGGCEYYKAYGLRTDGQPCVDALDALYVCLSTVDCAELADPENPAPSCGKQFAAIEAACPGFEDPGMTTGGSSGGSSSG